MRFVVSISRPFTNTCKQSLWRSCAFPAQSIRFFQVTIERLWRSGHRRKRERDPLRGCPNRSGLSNQNFLEWKQEFRRISLDAELGRLHHLASGLCDNAMTDIHTFNRNLTEQVGEALAAPRASEPRVVDVALRLTIPI